MENNSSLKLCPTPELFVILIYRRFFCWFGTNWKRRNLVADVDYRVDVCTKHCLHSKAFPCSSKEAWKQRHRDQDFHCRKRSSHHSNKVRSIVYPIYRFCFHLIWNVNIISHVFYIDIEGLKKVSRREIPKNGQEC